MEKEKKTKCMKIVKNILIIDLCLIVLLAIWMIRNGIILNSLVEKAKIINEKNNIHTEYVGMSEDYITIKEVYYDNGKGLIKRNIYDKNTLEVMHILEEKYDGENEILSKDELDCAYLEFENTWHFIKACVTARIKTVVCNDEEVYRISGVNPAIEKISGEVYWYVDKETGMFVRIYGRDSFDSIFARTYDMVEDYKVEFDLLTMNEILK